MNLPFNENSRVKIPAILHLTRLGYEFIDHRNYEKRTDCNIFIDIFQESILRLNPDLEKDEIPRILDELSLLLNYEDLGEAFYRRIQRKAGILLVDFEDFERNSFHVVTELTCKNEDEEFRPDITILVNGMPLVFIEVKKPNNTDGILAERERINKRFLNPKFRRFINLTQMILYSNNMEYDDNSTEPIQGAFYSTTSTDSAIFHLFREEENLSDYEYLLPENEDLMDMILRNNNLTVIKHSPEFVSNRVPSTPTNRLLTSLLKKDRLAFFLEYGIAYVREGAGKPEKHIMRYPQVFATKAIASKLDKGIKKGIIWHTQGSGKTALAFYNVHHLTDYYHKIKVVPKFYFIVDRLDLAIQATKEFTIRGLHVVNVDSKEEFKSLFQKVQVRQNVTGTREITVVNIQKFKDDTEVLDGLDYDLSIQRIYFLDEVHRSYKETGSFLVNLLNSDRDAVMIGLTGTPIIQTDRTKSTKLFGGYIHKYYYNSSIADGYTLRLIREGIESNYKMQLENVLKDIQVLKGDSERRFVYSHKKFVEPMLDYIIDDFVKSRDRLGDATIGGMVVCDSSDQAKALYDLFLEKYSQDPKPEEIQSDRKTTPVLKAASPKKIFKLVDSGDLPKKSLKAKLILHDIGTKDTRKEDIEAFKSGDIDLLFVYNMLLTGFDAKRLKKLYLGRVVRDHNLLQTLTRVNRPYKNFRYGYVVDFADIRSAFNKANKEYFDELQEELGDELQTYSNLFKTKEEIELEIQEIQDKLFSYNLENAEEFSRQISAIEDRKLALEIKKSLESLRNLHNIIKIQGDHEFLEKIDFQKINILYNEASRHLDLLNLKENMETGTGSTHLLDSALENVLFRFRKISEEELIIADKLKDALRRTRETLRDNFDQADPQWISLFEELKNLFQKKNLSEISQEEMKQNIGTLEHIYSRILELNRKNDLIRAKYKSDKKYARIHKRLWERGNISSKESLLHNALTKIKGYVDERILLSGEILENEGYFGKMIMPIIIESFEGFKIQLDIEAAHFVKGLIAKEYITEYQGVA